MQPIVIGPSFLLFAAAAVMCVVAGVVVLVVLLKRHSPIAAAPTFGPAQNALLTSYQKYREKVERKELLNIVGAGEGHDLEALIDQANKAKADFPGKAAVARAAASAGAAILLAICLASPAQARGPEVFVPTDRTPVVDSPRFAVPPQQTKPAEVLLPNGWQLRPQTETHAQTQQPVHYIQCVPGGGRRLFGRR